MQEFEKINDKSDISGIISDHTNRNINAVGSNANFKPSEHSQSNISSNINNSKDKVIPIAKPNQTALNNEKKPYIGFSTGFIIKSIFCPGSIEKNKDSRDYIYRKFNIYLSERFDVLFYLKNLEKNDRMRILFLNSNQNISLDFLKKPNLNKKEELDHLCMPENSDEQIRLITKYFVNKLKSKEMDKNDFYLYKNLESSIKKGIKSELNTDINN
jgi:hypothetical protein